MWGGIAALLAAAVIVAVVASTAVPAPPGSRELGAVFLLVAVPMTAVDLALAYVITRRMRRKAPPGGSPEALAATQTIVASAVALGAALMSCVFFFVSREPLLLALVLPCATVLLHWRPTGSRWARLAPAPPGSAAPRRMIRE